LGTISAFAYRHSGTKKTQGNQEDTDRVLILIESNFLKTELNRLCTTQLTVVFYNWLHQQHVLALLGHHQAYKD